MGESTPRIRLEDLPYGVLKNALFSAATEKRAGEKSRNQYCMTSQFFGIHFVMFLHECAL